MAVEFPFETPGNHLIAFEASVNGTGGHRFILDTGCGIELMSDALCSKLLSPMSGEAETVRTTGEFLSLSSTKVHEIALGGQKLLSNWQMGVTDTLDGFLRDFGRVDGALSLKAFEGQPFTLDFRERIFRLEDEESLKECAQSGLVMALSLKKPMPDALLSFVNVDALGVYQGHFALDTSVGMTILNLKTMPIFGLSPDSADVRRVQGWSESGEPQPRYYAKLTGQIALNDLAAEADPTVCFQKLGCDGILGINFLKDKAVTFDIPRKRLIFT